MVDHVRRGKLLQAACRLLVFLQAPVCIMAQDGFKLGAIGGYDIDQHNSKFAKLTSLGYCCPTDFGSVSGNTIYGGISYDLPPFGGPESAFTIGLAAGYQQRVMNTSFSAPTYVNDPETNQGRDGTINYTMGLKRGDAFVDVTPRFLLTNALKLSVGARIGYALTSSLTQREELGSELVRDGFYFIDQASQERLPYRNIYEGAIPDVAAVSFAASAGITYDIKLNAIGTTVLAPGLWYRYQPHGFSSGVTSRTIDPITGSAVEAPGSWAIQSIGASLSLKFSSAPTVVLDPCQEIVNGEVVPKRCPEGTILRLNPTTNECRCEETVRIDTSIVTIKAVYTRVNGSLAEQPLTRIDVSRSPQVNYLPIVYLVGFNQGSSNVDLVNRYIDIGPERKQSYMREKSFSRLYQKHVLNIIGSRYANGSLTRLTIVGFAHGSEPTPDALALERAVKVREQLYRRWGIPLSDITVRRATPEEAAMYTGSLPAQSDMRMALLYLNDSPDIVDYIETEDKHIRVSPDNMSVQVEIELGNKKTISSLDYQLKLGGNTGGKMIQPVRRVVNANESDFAALKSVWDVALDGAQSEIGPSLKALPQGEGTKLIPTLRVSTSTGQVIEAERDNAKSVIPIRVREVSDVNAEEGDSIYKSIAMLELPYGSIIEKQQMNVYGKLLQRAANAGVRVELSDAATRILESIAATTASRSTLELLNTIPISQRRSEKWLSPALDREDPLGISAYPSTTIQQLYKR